MDKHSKHVVTAIRIIEKELNSGQALEIRRGSVLPIIEDDLYTERLIALDLENDQILAELLEQLGG